jgi:hypothetical protein
LKIHRVLEGALDYVAPTGVKDEVEREKDGRGEYMCRPGEDIGGRLVNAFFLWVLGFRVWGIEFGV